MCQQLGGLSPARLHDVRSLLVSREQVCHTSLGLGDTEALFAFARAAWPEKLRGIAEGVSGSELPQPDPAAVARTASVPLLQPGAWCRTAEGLLHVGGAEHYAGMGYSLALGDVSLPVVHVGGAGEERVLLPFYVRQYLVLLLLPRVCLPGILRHVRHVSMRLVESLGALPSMVSKAVDDATQEHIQGQRYLR